MTVLHATEASSVHLSVLARTEGLGLADIEHTLYSERSLVKLLAMRRTLFAFPADLVPAALGSASVRVASQHARRAAKAIAASDIAADGEAWFANACDDVYYAIHPGEQVTIAQLRQRVPSVDCKVTVSPGTRWGGEIQLAPWVVQQLQLRGRLVRAGNAGHWRLNKPLWARASDWLGSAPVPLDEADGYSQLVRRWLATFGPGTIRDIEWWLGATKTAVVRALRQIQAVEVKLDDGTGWVLPDDIGSSAEVEPWGALLPVLDPTTMGWKQRGFYLDDQHVPFLFDSNGNGGSTAWWNGRIVGCWVQDQHGVVTLSLLEDVGAAATRVLQGEADRLTALLDGVVIAGPYSSLQMKGARLP